MSVSSKQKVNVTQDTQPSVEVRALIGKVAADALTEAATEFALGGRGSFRAAHVAELAYANKGLASGFILGGRRLERPREAPARIHFRRK